MHGHAHRCLCAGGFSLLLRFCFRSEILFAFVCFLAIAGSPTPSGIHLLVCTSEDTSECSRWKRIKRIFIKDITKVFWTWIITCFCLQLLLLNPLVKAQSSCGNPVTDDVNDIAKLVGNLPNDYMITLKYVPKMDSLPSHCWLHLMVPEFSRSLHNLLQKFSDIPDMSDVLSNYSIINNLTRIINDLMACLAFDKNKDFVKENGHLYEEGHFIPEDFFRHFNSTIEVYKESADRLDKNDCILPSTVGTPENDSRVAVTKTFLFPPVAASSLRNDSIGSSTSSNKEALGFINSSSLQGISIALTSLLSLLIGFILGAIYWKKIHPKSRPESDETTQCHDYQEENEISMLQQKEKEHLQV